jgi:hypothetical protein
VKAIASVAILTAATAGTVHFASDSHIREPPSLHVGRTHAGGMTGSPGGISASRRAPLALRRSGEATIRARVSAGTSTAAAVSTPRPGEANPGRPLAGSRGRSEPGRSGTPKSRRSNSGLDTSKHVSAAVRRPTGAARVGKSSGERSSGHQASEGASQTQPGRDGKLTTLRTPSTAGRPQASGT